jgi:hypothetical protein
MKKGRLQKTIAEPVRNTKVFREADVVVVGGGPGGVGAAICAARAGADTILIERYGHLGGMATGGLVNIIPNLGDIYGKQHIFGLCQELIDRLDARQAASYPAKKDWGTSDRKIVDYYLDANLRHFYVRNDPQGKEIVLYTALVDPEVMKDELNTMVTEAGAKILLHSWVTEPIMDGNTLKGIIFESKSGRQAILGKVIIDSTGDGDLLPLVGAEYISKIDPALRISHLCFCFWIANVDIKKADDFKLSHPQKHEELVQELTRAGGFPFYFKTLLKTQEGVIWFHPHLECSSQTDVEEMTRIDITSRKRALITWEFLKKYVPGFEKSFMMLTAPQLGTTGGRRIVGEYMLTEEDMNRDEPFEDTIVVFADNDRGELSHKHPEMFIPYRSLVPQKIDGLLVACRAFSSEDGVNDVFNLIPHCLCFGQAAGTAAALAIDSGVSVRNVDYKALRDSLKKQGVNLPDVKTVGKQALSREKR